MSDWIDRKKDGLPNERCLIRVSLTSDGTEFDCEWTPYDRKLDESVPKIFRPTEGYLGTTRVVEGECKGIGFHSMGS